MKKDLHVGILIHPELEPNTKKIYYTKKQRFKCPSITEWDIWRACRQLYKKVSIISLPDSLTELSKSLRHSQVDIVINLTEEFKGDQTKDCMVANALERSNIPFVGGNAHSLKISRNKVKIKKILGQSNVDVPEKYNGKNFPVILKLINADASLGISKRNIVFNHEDYLERKKILEERYCQKAFAEEFVSGREIFISIWKDKNGKLIFNKPRELIFKKSKKPSQEIFTERYKWSYDFQKKMGIQTKSAKLNRNEIKKFKEISFELYNELQLSSHVRFDFRYSDKGIFLIDVNSNPNLAKDDDFALSYSKSYKHLINELVESSLKMHSSKEKISIAS